VIGIYSSRKKKGGESVDERGEESIGGISTRGRGGEEGKVSPVSIKGDPGKVLRGEGEGCVGFRRRIIVVMEKI